MAIRRRELPSCSELYRLFSYNPETGEFLWRPRLGSTQGDKAFTTRFGGKPAGYIQKQKAGLRYRSLILTHFKQRCFAHRIIWKMMTGQEPPDFLDHKDGNGLNLRWNNLRQATNSENMCNGSIPKSNTSGIKGVFWDTERQKWRAQIKKNKKLTILGRFDTLEEAATIVSAARVDFHGEFARHR